MFWPNLESEVECQQQQSVARKTILIPSLGLPLPLSQLLSLRLKRPAKLFLPSSGQPELWFSGQMDVCVRRKLVFTRRKYI